MIEILYEIFGPGRIVIAQAPDQKIRSSNNPKWVKPRWRANREFVKTNEKKSLRQKKNLVNFVNQFASKFNLAWELQPKKEYVGGKVIVMSDYQTDFHNEIYGECVKDGNKAYEMLFLVPPSLVIKDGEKEITYKPIRPNPNDPDTGNDVITITSYQFRIWLSVTLTNLSGQSYRAVFRPIAFYTSRKAVASAAQPQGSEQIKASSKPYNETVYCFQNIGAGYPNIIKGDILDQLRIEISL